MVPYQKSALNLTTMIGFIVGTFSQVQWWVWGWKVSECKFWKILFGNHAFYTSGVPQAVKALGPFTAKQIAFTMNK